MMDPADRRNVIREYARLNTRMLEDVFRLRKLLAWALKWAELMPQARDEPEYWVAKEETKRGGNE